MTVENRKLYMRIFLVILAEADAMDGTVESQIEQTQQEIEDLLMNFMVVFKANL